MAFIESSCKQLITTFCRQMRSSECFSSSSAKGVNNRLLFDTLDVWGVLQINILSNSGVHTMLVATQQLFHICLSSLIVVVGVHRLFFPLPQELYVLQAPSREQTFLLITNFWGEIKFNPNFVHASWGANKQNIGYPTNTENLDYIVITPRLYRTIFDHLEILTCRSSNWPENSNDTVTAC